MNPKTVVIPVGEFIRGGSIEDRFTNPTELPRRVVQIEDQFSMSIHPVTWMEWGYYEPDHERPPSHLPVTGISWYQANEYCAWLSNQTGTRWRLPSETEWEYACRAGTTSPFSTGDNITTEQANFLYDEEGKKVGVGKITATDTFPPNGFGLCDMHGNVSEWTNDFWRDSYKDHAVGDPNRRVVRGGSWDHLPRLLRSSCRDALPPDTKRDNLGFRVVCFD